MVFGIVELMGIAELISIIEIYGLITGIYIIFLVLAIFFIYYIVKSLIDTQISKELEKIKQVTQQNSIALEKTMVSMNQGNRVFYERRLFALDSMWNNLVELKDKLGQYFLFYDILLPSEYEKASKKQFKHLFEGEKSRIFVTDLIHKVNLSKLRPYLGEELWELYVSIIAFEGRVCILPNITKEKIVLKDWREDKPTMDILQSILEEDEIRQIKAMRIASISPIINLIEIKILDKMSKMMFGEDIANKTFDAATKLFEKQKWPNN